MQGQVAELNGQLEGLEKERDFYFEKVCTHGVLLISMTLVLTDG